MKLSMSAVLSILMIGLSGCKDSETDVHIIIPINEDHGTIADPHTRWQVYHLTSYVIDQRSSCFCLFGGDVCKVYVRDNKVIDVIKKSDGKSIFAEVPNRYKTVDELFALAASLHPDSVASLEIEYDAKFGFPAFISVDNNAQIADDEYSYITQNIERLIK